ncbi:MAG: hypothetical protein AB1742_10750 [bacterium]
MEEKRLISTKKAGKDGVLVFQVLPLDIYENRRNTRKNIIKLDDFRDLSGKTGRLIEKITDEQYLINKEGIKKIENLFKTPRQSVSEPETSSPSV